MTENSFASQPILHHDTLHHEQAAQDQVLDDGIILKVWRTVILQPFDLQRNMVPLCKDLNQHKTYYQLIRLSAILEYIFSLLKQPYFNSIYLLRV